MRWDRCGEIQRQKVRAYLVLGLLSAALAVVLHLLYHRQTWETAIPNDCFAAAAVEPGAPRLVCLTAPA